MQVHLSRSRFPQFGSLSILGLVLMSTRFTSVIPGVHHLVFSSPPPLGRSSMTCTLSPTRGRSHIHPMYDPSARAGTSPRKTNRGTLLGILRKGGQGRGFGSENSTEKVDYSCVDLHRNNPPPIKAGRFSVISLRYPVILRRKRWQFSAGKIHPLGPPRGRLSRSSEN